MSHSQAIRLSMDLSPLQWAYYIFGANFTISPLFRSFTFAFHRYSTRVRPFSAFGVQIPNPTGLELDICKRSPLVCIRI